MSIWNKKPPKADDEPYDPARLFDIHEHGMTLNMDQFMKKPGIQEDLAAMRAIGRAIREKQQREAMEKQGDDKWTFDAKQNGEHVGTLKVTQDSVTWQPKYQSAERATRLNWRQFGELMQQHGDRVQRKAK